ncbi:glycosyltransferase family 4 protein [Paramagnetospirillum magneticum]|uniref:Glycosyltransferase n=1 Tax=Paramagnetospirillum magneticum (strain ATCC 700264 / AMB-1) TaxID=342108 RepID=Q2W8D8_PARM1|nr:glycosyltransferase family 1 protein [Paramagnetospirillum magneticum]BAE49887.1 Glycosyltransferase [Paramagnetospirillum magneticum AMB-1]
MTADGLREQLIQAPVQVIVDFVPVMPGGENGEAQQVALGLLEGLMALQPQWTFHVLVNSLALDYVGEFAPAANVICVRDSGGPVHIELPELPGRQVGHVVLCPFSGPTYHSRALPLVSVIHDLLFALYPQYFLPEEESERRRNLRYTREFSDLAVCVSDHVRQTVIEAAEFPAERVRTIRTRLAPRLAPVRSTAILDHLGLRAQGYLVYPADTGLHKNHEMLLTALGIYRCRHPKSDLVLVCCGVGDNARAKEVKAAAVSMGLSVLFLGHLNGEDLSALISNSLALIFPSLVEEYGTALREAMALGAPVLCSNGAGLSEIVGDASLAFDARNPNEIAAAIERCEQDPALREELRQKGLEWVGAAGSLADAVRGYRDVMVDAMIGRGVTVDRLPRICAPEWRVGTVLDLTLPDSRSFLLAGWWSTEGHGIWLKDECSEIRFEADDTREALVLTMEITPFMVHGLPTAYPLGIVLNDRPLATLTVGMPGRIVVPVPAEVWNAARIKTLCLRPRGGRTPASLGVNADTRRLSVAIRTLAFLHERASGVSAVPGDPGASPPA